MGAKHFIHRHLVQFACRRLLVLRNAGPVVSFTFDDFPRSAYTEGGAVLREFGARGTYYTAPGLMNASNASGDQFRIDDLHALVADGHELANHTLHHISSRETSAEAYLQDAVAGRAALRDIPGLMVSDNFAYPFGAVTLASKRAVGAQMQSCRGTGHGVNGRKADLNLLRANPIYGDTAQLDGFSRLFEENERVGGWLIFYTHDVRKNPSPYGCTPKLFESVVRLAGERQQQILTINKVLVNGAQTKAATESC